jgi:hypothetical protein
MPPVPPSYAALVFAAGAVLPFAVVLVCFVINLVKR